MFREDFKRWVIFALVLGFEVQDGNSSANYDSYLIKKDVKAFERKTFERREKTVKVVALEITVYIA